MKCTDCKYHLEDDYGYSNWTVEGTDVFCLLNLNPELPVDRWYNEDPALNFAEKCKKFVEGDGVCLDVDRELLEKHDAPLSSAYTDDAEIKLLLDKWENK